MGTFEEWLAVSMDEFDNAVTEYTTLTAPDSVDFTPELRTAETRLRNAGWSLLPVIYVWYRAVGVSAERRMMIIGQCLIRLVKRSRADRAHIRSLTARVEDLEKRIRYLEQAAVRNTTGPGMFVIPEWNNAYAADQQACTTLTMLLGQLRERFAAPADGGGS